MFNIKKSETRTQGSQSQRIPISDITHMKDGAVWVDSSRLSETQEWPQMYATFEKIIGSGNFKK